MTARCVHNIREDQTCAACDDVGPAFRALSASYGGRFDREGIRFESELIREGYAAGRADGALGRGSRARYWRAVRLAAEIWELHAGDRDEAWWSAPPASYVAWCTRLSAAGQLSQPVADHIRGGLLRARAARRARAILAALDGAR